MSIASEIDATLSDFPSISLEEVQKASLLRRKDRKYIFSYVDLAQVLRRVEQYYRVLEIEGIRSHPYNTYYYDTHDLEMYHKHHRSMANRHKIRFREYGTSEVVFLEVKMKNSKGITEKNRVRTEGKDASFLSKEEKFLTSYSPYGGAAISQALENSFKRVTLVNESQSERITLDYNLSFTGNGLNGGIELPGISIAEIKFEKHLSGSPFHHALRQSKITSRRFSKYAIGMALVNPELKQNRFKEKVRRVHRINSDYIQLNK